jgi:hypothetical protein
VIVVKWIKHDALVYVVLRVIGSLIIKGDYDCRGCSEIVPTFGLIMG